MKTPDEMIAECPEKHSYVDGVQKAVAPFASGIGIADLMKKIALDARLRALTVASANNVPIKDLQIRGTMRAFRKEGEEDVHELILEDCEINPELTKRMQEYYRATPEGQVCNFTFKLAIKDGRTKESLQLPVEARKYVPLIFANK